MKPTDGNLVMERNGLVPKTKTKQTPSETEILFL